MKKSSFQFSSPELLRLVFSINEAFQNDGPVKIPVGTFVAISRDYESNAATVELTLELGSKDDSSPFYVEAVQRANFRWGSDVNDVDVLLNQNAPALLLGYMRSPISVITSLSRYPAYSIPFLNFTE